MGGENVDDCDEIMMQWIDHTSEIQTWDFCNLWIIVSMFCGHQINGMFL